MKKLSLGVLFLALALVGCAQGVSSDNKSSTLSSTSNASALNGSLSLIVKDSANALVYSDSNSSTALNLKANTSYNVQLNAAGFPANTAFILESTLISAVNGATEEISLKPGNNSITVPEMGDYNWKIVAKAVGFLQQSRFYQASVTCANPTFSQASLNANALSVSGSSNLYTINAAGVIASADGQAPYTCAYDQTGTGIVNTAFGSCNSSGQLYSNLVGVRNVSVVVKDSCNRTFSVSKAVSLNYSVPSMPGNVFIFGQVSNASGSAIGDQRVDGATYLATNVGGHNVVQPNYDKGSFTINAAKDYGMASSVPFGVKIEVRGITESGNSISAANATISRVTYSTDEKGDGAGAVSFSGSSCSLTNQGAQKVVTTGQPCSAGQSGENKTTVVEVWGHYVCTGLNSSGGSIKLEGDFDGYVNLVDNCVGGGGGGGGGVVPINL